MKLRSTGKRAVDWNESEAYNTPPRDVMDTVSLMFIDNVREKKLDEL